MKNSMHLTTLKCKALDTEFNELIIIIPYVSHSFLIQKY